MASAPDACSSLCSAGDKLTTRHPIRHLTINSLFHTTSPTASYTRLIILPSYSNIPNRYPPTINRHLTRLISPLHTSPHLSTKHLFQNALIIPPFPQYLAYSSLPTRYPITTQTSPPQLIFPQALYYHTSSLFTITFQLSNRLDHFQSTSSFTNSL